VSQLITILALLIAVMFLVSAVAKLLYYSETAKGFTNLGLAFPNQLAGLVIAAELIAVVLLVWRPQIGSYIATLLLTGFTTVLIQAMRNDYSLNCACFGALSSGKVGWWSIARNLTFLFAAIFINLA